MADGLAQKIVISVLAAIAVLTTSLSQLEHPHERWVLFRRYQRLFEAERTKFIFGLSPYDQSSTCEQLLARKTIELQLDLHANWESVIPSTADLIGSNETTK